jgi:hypothetical protein
VTRDEIAARLSGGGLKLAFDTNALYFDRRLVALCSDTEVWNERLERRALPRVQLVVCTVAHAEKLIDLKQIHRDRFDRGVILRGLTRKGLRIQPFEAEHALETGIRLGERYPEEADWHRAKKERYLRSLGLSLTTEAPGSGKRCGATVDWLIGAHASAEGCVLVTEDTGPEFDGLTGRVRLEVLEAALGQLLSEPV